MPPTTSEQVGKVVKATFARFGIPEQIVSANGPQYSSEVWKNLCRQYDIVHVTSSPHNPQGNGHAEHTVQTAKCILKHDDPLLALMCFRPTPTTSTGISPAELLMGRKIRTTLPSLRRNLIPKWPDNDLVRRRDGEAKLKQAFYFNKRHRVRDLPQLQPVDQVLLKLDGEKTWNGPASVPQESSTPRSYQVYTPGGEVRRTRRHLQLIRGETAQSEIMNSETMDWNSEPRGAESRQQGSSSQALQGQVVTGYGRVCKPVVCMDM